ncbi:MAG: GNAT family N-acetyltransferase [Pirellulales bacterium]|nr:GNAT family N-acetyltransferase [Pirellulales bacterium]
MHLEIVSTFSRFAALRSDWNRVAGDIPMRGWEWAYSWAETMLGKGRLMIMVGSDQQGRIVGIAPFYLKPDWLRGNVIRFLGDGKCCTDYATLLATPQAAEEFSEQVAETLTQAGRGFGSGTAQRREGHPVQPSEWDLISLQGVSWHDPMVRKLLQQLEHRRCVIHSRQTQACWRVSLPDDWETFVASLSKSQRRNVRLVQRRVLEDPHISVRIADDRDALDIGLRWFRDLHQKRWQQAGQEGCFADQAFASFVEMVAPRLFETGQLRVLSIENQGVPIAVDFSLLSQDASFGYQMGIDPDYRGRQLGRALLVAAMRATHRSGRRVFDFLRGDEHYKSRWTARACPLAEIEIVPNRSLPRIGQGLIDLGRCMKSGLRGTLQRCH